MRTIKTVMRQLTDAKSIMQDMMETLRALDPEFPEAEAKFLKGAEALERELGGDIFPPVSGYLSALEEEFAAAVIYIGWQGFGLNLKIFNDPANARRLKEDYEELHGEGNLAALPTVKEARRKVSVFYEALRKLPGDRLSLTEDITAYYAYLETAGYKLAHYFGFRLAEDFLHHVVPGYHGSGVYGGRYAAELGDYLKLDLALVE